VHSGFPDMHKNVIFLNKEGTFFIKSHGDYIMRELIVQVRKESILLDKLEYQTCSEKIVWTGTKFIFFFFFLFFFFFYSNYFFFFLLKFIFIQIN
jgi:hypothetical protein